MKSVTVERRNRLTRSPAEVFLWISAAYLLFLGLGSFVVNPSFAVGDDVSVRNLFGILETNGSHGLAGLLTGLASLVFLLSKPLIRMGAAVIGGVLIGSAFVFFLSGNGSVAMGLIPVDFTDAVVLHLIPGVIGLACAAATRNDRAQAD